MPVKLYTVLGHILSQFLNENVEMALKNDLQADFWKSNMKTARKPWNIQRAYIHCAVNPCT